MNISSLNPIGSCTRDTSVARIIAKELEAIGAFQVSPQTLELLTRESKVELYRKGKVLLDRAAHINAAFVVKSGSAQVTEDNHDNTRAWAFTEGDLILFKASFRNGEFPATVVYE